MYAFVLCGMVSDVGSFFEEVCTSSAAAKVPHYRAIASRRLGDLRCWGRDVCCLVARLAQSWAAAKWEHLQEALLWGVEDLKVNLQVGRKRKAFIACAQFQRLSRARRHVSATVLLDHGRCLSTGRFEAEQPALGLDAPRRHTHGGGSCRSVNHFFIHRIKPR